jgi:hypothetical protein
MLEMAPPPLGMLTAGAATRKSLPRVPSGPRAGAGMRPTVPGRLVGEAIALGGGVGGAGGMSLCSTAAAVTTAELIKDQQAEPHSPFRFRGVSSEEIFVANIFSLFL